MKLKFARFAEAAHIAGFEAVDFSTPRQRCWGIRKSPLLVNFYPSNQTVYVVGTKTGFRGGIEQAVKAASTPPKCRGVRAKRRASYGPQRRDMLAVYPHCHWCRVGLDDTDATVDHRIPLSRGGLNNRNNLVLACAPCNQGRGNAMPEIVEAAEAAGKDGR